MGELALDAKLKEAQRIEYLFLWVASKKQVFSVGLQGGELHSLSTNLITVLSACLILSYSTNWPEGTNISTQWLDHHKKAIC